MKLTSLSLTLLLFTVSCGSSGSAPEFADFGPDPMSNPAFLEAMMAAATPGEPHAELMKGVGFWRVEGEAWMGPGMEPITMVGTANVKSLLGGRYLMQEFRSEWMGQPFEGIYLMGYDNVTQEYFSVWIDSSSTGYALSEGRSLDGGDIAMSGTMRDIKSPGGRPYRSVMRVLDANKSEMTMYDTLPDGGEFMVMRMTYTR